MQKNKEKIEHMFDKVSQTYDILNHGLSLGLDNLWRKKALKLANIKNKENLKYLDVATGTADFLIETTKNLELSEVTGVDLSEKMLEIARDKIFKKNCKNKVSFLKADCEYLPFEENSFDIITVGFGVRNFENLTKGLSEMQRVLRPDGTLIILEFSQLKKNLLGRFLLFYFKWILPAIGQLFSNDKEAYRYLFESAVAFPSGDQFCSILSKVGLINIKNKTFSAGLVSVYISNKKAI